MRSHRVLAFAIFVAPIIAGGSATIEDVAEDAVEALGIQARFEGPTSSGPIQITSDDRYIWVANPDNNSVSLIEVRRDRNRKLAEIPVGEEPQDVAISPDDRFVYVSNTVSGTVSVIRNNPDHPRLVRTINVGTEPYGMALTPNGEKLYVANARSNDVSVIDTKRQRVIGVIDGVGLEPRGIAITNDGDRRDNDEKVYVTQFLGVDVPGTTIGADNYKEGRVTVISTRNDRVIGQVVLKPQAETGFRAAGDALARIAPGAAFTFNTGAFPNMLNSVVIKGDRAYLPNTAASPNGPVRFNVNVQAFLSVIDIDSDTEGQVGGQVQTINMNRGINFEPAGANKVFLGVPWAAAFKHRANEGYVVAAAANLLVRVVLDANGTPTINAPQAAGDPGAIVRIFVGQNPRGVVINSTDTRAYVMNEVSRDVSVVDLASNQVIATVASARLPRAGSDQARTLIGKGVFNSSTGVNIPGLGVTLETRLSSEGWSGCFSCHPSGLTDGVVWIFPNGPRRTLPLNGTFNPRNPNDIKILNHSGVRDEVQDFELNIRAVSGGKGLILLADGTQDLTVANFGAPTTGRNELLDDMAFYVAHGVRTPISPLTARLARGGGDDDDSDSGRGRGRGRGHGRGHDDDDDDDGDNGDNGAIARGRNLFREANCASCHGGGGWSVSRRNFTPPPDASLINAGQIVGLLRPVGTFDPTAANEVRDNAAAALGAAGFVVPSLLGAHGLGPFLHNGSAITLDDVLELVPHRSAGTGGVDRLSRRADRAALVEFLKSIDASTKPFSLGTAVAQLEGESERVVTEDTKTVEFRLEPIFPNPAREGATVGYSIPAPGRVKVGIFDVLGRRVASLVDGPIPAGQHQVRWDGRSEGGSRAWPGVYFVRIDAEGRSKTRTVILAP